MGHAQNKKQFFFSEMIKPDPKLLKTFYFKQNIKCFSSVMNVFLCRVMHFCSKVPFPAITAVQGAANDCTNHSNLEMEPKYLTKSDV